MDGIVVDAGLTMMGASYYRHRLQNNNTYRCKEKESNREEKGKAVFPLRDHVPVSTLAVLWP